MITVLISILVFALAVSVKGGLLGNIFTNWKRLVERVETTFSATLSELKASWSDRAYGRLVKAAFVLPFRAFAKWFLDGSVISLFIVFVYVAASQPSLTVAALFALSWCLIWMSMGEEAGAAGDYKEAWGDYMEAVYPASHSKAGQLMFGRSYGIKKGIQYGAFCGAGMALAMGSWCLWIAGALFPLCYFTGNSIQRFVSGGAKRGWVYSEPLWGAVVGLGYGLAKHGLLPVHSVFTFPLF